MNCPKCGTEFQVVFSGQPSAKVKRVSTMSDEQRKAVGIRLQTARAAKMGLTLDQLRTLKIRPGQDGVLLARACGHVDDRIGEVLRPPHGGGMTSPTERP